MPQRYLWMVRRRRHVRPQFRFVLVEVHQFLSLSCNTLASYPGHEQ